MKIIEDAVKRGAAALSEFESKQLLSAYNIAVTREKVTKTLEETIKAANDIGYPVVLKGSGEDLNHKTELNLIRLDLRDENDVKKAHGELTSHPEVTVNEVLVQQMVKGDRELVVGMTRDEQFGPCVMFGLGGILTEILQDTSFRVAPLTDFDAMEMMNEIRGNKILESFRGKPAVDKETLATILISIGRMALENDNIQEIDINPLKVIGGKPVAVDALVILNNNGNSSG